MHFKKNVDTYPKTFVELFSGFRDYCFYKCDGQIPYYFAKLSNYRSKIFSTFDDNYEELPIDIPNFYIEILQEKKIFRKNFTELYFIFKNARKIDVLYQYQFGITPFHRLSLNCILYKLLNPKGLVFIRFEADLSLLERDYFIVGGNSIKKKILDALYKNYFKKIDIFGVCDFEDLRKLKEFKNLINCLDLKKVKIQPNGFNINHILYAVSQIKTFKNKENIIVASGRLNDPLKGMDILFEALNKIKIKNWKVFLIGSDGDYLKKLHSDFIKLNPELKDQIINVGFLEDRNKYFSLLNQSKIYVLPSRIDGMPHVIPEAMALGNVIIGSSHHGVRVATEDGEIGRIHEIGDSEKLSEILKELIDNEILLEELSIASYNKAHNEFEWGKIVQNVFKDYL